MSGFVNRRLSISEASECARIRGIAFSPIHPTPFLGEPGAAAVGVRDADTRAIVADWNHRIDEHDWFGAALDRYLDRADLRDSAIDDVSLADTNWAEENRDRTRGG
jgi:hypothetical protein